MNGENKHLFSIKLSYRCVFTCCRPPRSSPLPPSYFILAPIGANLSFSRLEWKQTLFFSLPYIFTEIACEKFNLHYIKHKNIAFAKKITSQLLIVICSIDLSDITSHPVKNLFLSLHNSTETRIKYSTVMYSQFWGHCKYTYQHTVRHWFCYTKMMRWWG